MNKEIINGGHLDIGKGQYEWWYFDFVGKNGDAFNIIMHASDVFGIDQNTYYSASFLYRDGVQKYLRGKEKGFEIKRGGAFLSVENGLVLEDEKWIKFDLAFDDSTSIKGRIEKNKRLKPINNGVLYEAESRFGMWVPSIVNGKFDIQITKDGKEKFFRGHAYHDHQWGNLPIQEHIYDWVWGHFNQGSLGTVFFKIRTNSNDIINRYYLIDSNNVMSGSDEIREDFFAQLINNPKPETSRLDVNIDIESNALSFKISPDELMRRRIGERVGDKLFTYLRWSTDCVFGYRKMQGITEYMRFR
jgi:hypothetical protein